MFSTRDYKDILRSKLTENRGRRGYQQRLAEALGCHTSFISQVASGPTQLTPDHAAGLCAFWGLDDDETAWFMLLVEHARASTPRLRRLVEKRLDELLAKRSRVAARVGVKTEAAARYYASWHPVAVHVLLAIPGFSDPGRIAARLSLPEPFVAKTLAALAAQGLVREKANGAWEVVEHDLHLPGDSPFVAQHHANWRQYALVHLPERAETGAHYTSLLGISRADFEKIRTLLLDFIAESRKVAVESREEELYCLGVDLFRV